MTLIIEITSDFICPWCLVAESRLKRAMTQLMSSIDSPLDIQIVWHPFELNPKMPEMGLDRRTYRSNKFGSWEYSQHLDEQTVQAARNDDIQFRYDLIQVTPNTLKAHRLIWLAAQQKLSTHMAERILNAYFTEGQNIAEIATLAGLADDIGLDKNAVTIFLQSDEGTQEIRELEHQAIAQGIHGVPNIRIGQEMLSGAQSVEVMHTALQNAVQSLMEVGG